MWSAFAPVQAGSAKDTSVLATAHCQVGDVDADSLQERNSGIGYQPAIVVQNHVATDNQCIREGNAKAAGEMVVTGSRHP
jgi:hypothetical protein